MSYDSDRTDDNPVASEPESTDALDDAPASAAQDDQDEQDGGDGEDGEDGADGEDGEDKGNADPGKRFREMELSEEEQEQIAEEREHRLDPDNRPENAEVDNTNRTFEDGEFKD